MSGPLWKGAAPILRDADGSDPNKIEQLGGGLDNTNNSERLSEQRVRWLCRRHNLTLSAAVAVASVAFHVEVAR